MTRIGLQLYSIRELLEQDFFGSLEKVKHAGYDCVEFANFYGHSAMELKSALGDMGLEPYATHAPLGEDTQALARFCSQLGIRYAIAPYLPSDTLEACRAANALLKAAVPVFAAEGITVGYHNHWHEFVRYGERYALEIIMDGVEGIYEIDTAWVQKAGLDPLAYIRSLGGKVGPIHAKDINEDYVLRDPHDMSACVGEGVMDFAGIIAQLREVGTLERGLIVEQEAFEVPVFEALAKNASALRALVE